MPKESFYANGTIKVKNADGATVPFYPKTKTDCVYNYQTSQSLSSIISNMEDNIELAANSGGVKVTHDEVTDENATQYSNNSMIVEIEKTYWNITVDTRKISSSNATTAIPFNLHGQTGVKLKVYWGDGTSSVLTPSSFTSNDSRASWHTYSSPGEYTIRIGNEDWENTYMMNVAINHSPSTSYDITSNMYYYKKTLVALTPLPNIKGLKSIPGYEYNSNYWSYTTTNFSSIFCQCPSLTAIPAGLFDNLSFVSSITDLDNCFYNCTSITSVPESLFDKCTGTTDFNQCFWKCSALTSVPENLFKYNTEVTNFNAAFSTTGIHDLVLHIGSGNVTTVGSFVNKQEAYSRIVYVPAGSTSQATFNSWASYCGLTVIGE